MQPKVIEITNRIIERSQNNRQRYLGRIKQAGKSRRARTTLPCGNLAHGFAACSSSNKSDLTGSEKANVAIVSAYNDMLSAHQPYQDYPKRIKAAIEANGGVAQFAGGATSDNNYLYRGEANVDTRSYAAYSQLSWDWTDRTVLTAGLRYSYDEKKGNDNTFVQYVGDPDDPVVFRSADDDWDKFTWRLGVDHILADTHFLYGVIASGYRSGGFNFQKPTSSPLVDVVKPEQIISYEIGYKGVMWDNRINLSSSIYYYDYDDLQVLKQDGVEGIGLNTFVNADQANAWGVELESQALVTQ